jgi:hypothetical protein
MAEHHYTYGSGQYGCLYDSGPHIADTKEQAIEALLETFSDLAESELDAMSKHLASSCYHKFDNSEVRAGADYCEIVWQPGPAPEDTDGS